MKKHHIESEDVQKLSADAKAETRSPGQEVLEHLFEALLQTPSFTLKDGLEATVTPYFEPRMDDDGQFHCGIDVNFSDGSQLEFTLANTGWGSPMRPFSEMIAECNSTRSRD